MKTIPYRPEHAAEVIASGSTEPELAICPLTITLMEMRTIAGPAYTWEHEGRIVGCGGMTIPYKGFGEAWAIYVHDIKEIKSHPKAVYNKLHEVIAENEIIRCQIILRTDFPESIKYAEFLGFKFEAKHEKYFPDGTDAYMYVIIGE